MKAFDRAPISMTSVLLRVDFSFPRASKGNDFLEGSALTHCHIRHLERIYGTLGNVWRATFGVSIFTSSHRSLARSVVLLFWRKKKKKKEKNPIKIKRSSNSSSDDTCRVEENSWRSSCSLILLYDMRSGYKTPTNPTSFHPRAAAIKEG